MRLILVTAIAAIAAVGASFAFATAAKKPPAVTASDRMVLKQLKQLKRNVRGLQRTIGATSTGLQGEVREAKSAIDATKAALDVHARATDGDMNWVRADLTRICRAVC